MANISSVRGRPTNPSLHPLDPLSLDGSRLPRARSVLSTATLPTVNTGGPLPPQLDPTRNPNDFLVPNLNLTAGTGGGLPPSGGVGTVGTGGGLPPSGGVGVVRTGGELPPQQLPTVNTGGPLPPSQLPPVGTGGQLPPNVLPSLDGSQFVATSTGGGPTNSVGNTIGQMAQQYAYAPGASPASVAQQIAAQFNTTPGQLPTEVVQQINAAFAQQARPDPSRVALDAMDDILSEENSYIRNARLQGLELANSRGLMNSSVAAGSAQRAAIDASMPIFNQTMNLNSQREGQDFQATMQSRDQAFGLTSQRESQAWQEAQNQFNAAMQLEGQARDAALAQARDAFSAAQSLSQQREQQGFIGEQSALDRTQGVNNALLGSQLNERQMGLSNQYQKEQARFDAELRQQLQSDSVTQQDWLTDRQFRREFNGALSTMAVNGAYDLNRAVMEYAASNPEVYTPEIISGMTNFFQMNMTGLLQQYFPNLTGGNG